MALGTALHPPSLPSHRAMRPDCGKTIAGTLAGWGMACEICVYVCVLDGRVVTVL